MGAGFAAEVEQADLVAMWLRVNEANVAQRACRACGGRAGTAGFVSDREVDLGGYHDVESPVEAQFGQVDGVKPLPHLGVGLELREVLGHIGSHVTYPLAR